MLNGPFLKAIFSPFGEFFSVWSLVQLEAKVRYKRASFGIAWYFIAFALKIAVLGVVYTKALGRDPAEYLPFLVLGVSIWGFISGSIQYGCVALVNNEKFIYFDSRRLYFFVFKGVVRELLFALMLVSWSIFLSCILIRPTLWSLLLFVVGAALVFLVVYLAASILSILCLIKADLAHLVTSMMNVFFIATPIIWDFTDAPAVQELMLYNPFYYLIEVMRAPILGRDLQGVVYLFFVVAIPFLLLLLFWVNKLLKRGISSYV